MTDKQRVARGAKFLDHKVPGWHKRVVMRQLDMGDCYCCVVGQLFLEFWAGCYRLGIDNLPDVRKYGLDYLTPNELWKQEIRKRR